jgi:hypothetical protein
VLIPRQNGKPDQGCGVFQQRERQVPVTLPVRWLATGQAVLAETGVGAVAAEARAAVRSATAGATDVAVVTLGATAVTATAVATTAVTASAVTATAAVIALALVSTGGRRGADAVAAFFDGADAVVVAGAARLGVIAGQRALRQACFNETRVEFAVELGVVDGRIGKGGDLGLNTAFDHQAVRGQRAFVLRFKSANLASTT